MLKMSRAAVNRAASMLSRQGGRCAICHRVPDKGLVVDHDHDCCPTGSACVRCIRGGLCGSCNRALGLLGDDPERVRAAASYLGQRKLVLGYFRPDYGAPHMCPSCCCDQWEAEAA